MFQHFTKMNGEPLEDSKFRIPTHDNFEISISSNDLSSHTLKYHQVAIKSMRHKTRAGVFE